MLPEPADQWRSQESEGNKVSALRRGKTEEEIVNRDTGIDVVEQGLHGHGRAGEYWSPTHDVRRSAVDGLSVRLRPRGPPFSLWWGQPVGAPHAG